MVYIASAYLAIAWNQIFRWGLFSCFFDFRPFKGLKLPLNTNLCFFKTPCIFLAFYYEVCFAGTTWEGYFEDLQALKEQLEKHPEKIKDYLGYNNVTTPTASSAG